jgi:hypothetical protein
VIKTPKPARRDGPITGNQVVPCPWQKTPQSGPMIMAGDTALAATGEELVPLPFHPDVRMRPAAGRWSVVAVKG